MYQRKPIIFFMIFMFLFCLQISASNINNSYHLDFLLVFLAYALHQDQSLYVCLSALVGMEFLSLLQLGACGFSTIILTPLIVYFSDLKTFLHFKIVAPGLFILTYEILFELCMSLKLKNDYSIYHVCIKTALNFLLFLILYFTKPTLFQKHKTL